MEREPNTQYVLSYSYGKDSGACIHVVKDILGWPLDRIVTADVWATQDIPAVLPEMWEWQQKADDEIFRRWGIPVEHICATKKVIPRVTVGGVQVHLCRRILQSADSRKVHRKHQRIPADKSKLVQETQVRVDP